MVYKIQTVQVLKKLDRPWHGKCVLGYLLEFEADTINTLEDNCKCPMSNFWPKFYFEKQIVDFQLNLGQGCQHVICRSWWDKQIGFDLSKTFLQDVVAILIFLGGVTEHISAL